MITIRMWKRLSKTRSRTGSKLRWSKRRSSSPLPSSTRSSKGLMSSSRTMSLNLHVHQTLEQQLPRQARDQQCRLQSRSTCRQTPMTLSPKHIGRGVVRTIGAVNRLVVKGLSRRMAVSTADIVGSSFVTSIPCIR